MKKALSILIAISIAISLFPVAFAETAEADPVAKTYTFNYSAIGLTTSTVLSSIDGAAVDQYGNNIYETYGWKYFAMSDALKEKELKDESGNKKHVALVWTSGNFLYFVSNIGVSIDFALALKAPEISGFYIPTLSWYSSSGSTKTLDWYFAALDSKLTTFDDYTTTENFIMTDTVSGAEFTSESPIAIYSQSGDEFVTAFSAQKNKSYKFKTLTLNPILNPVMTTAIENSDDTTASALSFDLTDGETSNDSQTVVLSTTVSGTDVSGMPVSDNFITYKSSDESVATVAADGTITAVGDGAATIYAESSDKKYNSLSNGITVTVTAAPEESGETVTDTNKSVSVMPENSNHGTVTGLDNVIDEVEMGTTINPTAVPATGYKFAYWKNSSGTFLSANPSESFVINTNTAITAVFDKIEEDSDSTTVEFYNANGMLLHKNEDVALNTSFADVAAEVGEPSLVGYEFKHWSIYADKSEIDGTMPITTLTRAVAIYEEPEAQYTVKVGGTDVVENKEYKYGEAVTVYASDEENFSCWKIGDQIISYSPNYTFSVWGDVELTEVINEDAEEAPVAALIKNGENHLLIYSVPSGYTKIEAGIIFSSSASADVDSFDGQKTSEVRGTGQFMVSSDYENARGYLIFKNNTTGDMRILYAE